MLFKKGLSSVVSSSLIILVSVSSVLFFQGWFSNFSEKIFINSESSQSSSIQINNLVGNNIYLLNPTNSDVQIQKVLLNSIDCQTNQSTNSNIISVDVGYCLNQIDSQNLEVTIITNKNIFSKYFYNSNNFKSLGKLLISFTGSGDETISKIIMDSNGNLFSAGYSNSDTNIGNDLNLTNNGGSDLFLIKYNQNLIPQFVKTSYNSGSGNDYIQGISIDNQDNLYVTGRINSNINLSNNVLINYSGGGGDFFLTKYNNSGYPLFSKSDFSNSGNNYDLGFGVDLDSQNNIFVSGNTYSSLNFGNGVTISNQGNEDLFLVKYNSSGIAQFAKSTELNSGNSYDYGTGVKINSNDEIFLFGKTASSSPNFGNNLNFTKQAHYDLYLVKYNQSGIAQFLIHGKNGTSSEEISDIAFDSKGNIYAVGYTESQLNFENGIQINHSGGKDFIFLKINSSGQIEFAKSNIIGSGSQDDFMSRIKLDSRDNIFIVGSTNSNLSFGNNLTINTSSNRDFFLVKYDENGNPLELKTSKFDTNDQRATDLIINNKNVIVSGYTLGNITFENDEKLILDNQRDSFVYQFNYMAN